MSIRECTGDIFSSKSPLIGCTINIVGAAGVGIAKTVRDKHPDWYYFYKKVCRRGEMQGDRLFIYRPEGNYPYRIVGIPTKIDWKNPSDPDQIMMCVELLRGYIQTHKVPSIAIPRLGCSHGKLDYESEVKPMLMKYLDDLECDVEVWNLD